MPLPKRCEVRFYIGIPMFLDDVRKDAGSATFIMMKLHFSEDEIRIFLKSCFGLVIHLWQEKVLKLQDDSDRRIISELIERFGLDESNPKKDSILKSLIEITDIMFKDAVRFNSDSANVEFVLGHYNERCNTFLEAVCTTIKCVRVDVFAKG